MRAPSRPAARPAARAIHRSLRGSAARALLLAVGVWFGLGSVAWADALVVVEVRTSAGEPTDGQVTLQPVGEGAAHRCQTSGGRCRLANVPGGRYTVTFTPPGGSATAPRPAMIPPDGTVTLRVAAP